MVFSAHNRTLTHPAIVTAYITPVQAQARQNSNSGSIEVGTQSHPSRRDTSI